MSRKFTRKSTEERQAEMEAAHAMLAGRIEQITSAAEWREFLAFAARMYRYSFGNLIMALVQAEDRGMAPISQLASFTRWSEIVGNRKGERGVQVIRKGEHGLTIFRPILRKYREDEDGYDPKYPNRQRLVGFALAKTFDVQQLTDEARALVPERPDLGSLLTTSGDVPEGTWAALVAFAASKGYAVRFGDARGAEGYTDPQAKEIVVSEDHRGIPNVEVRILLHELAHMLLHVGLDGEDFDYRAHRGMAETEADGAAFVVAQALGLDIEGSAGYVAGWSKQDVDAITRAGDRIMKAAKAMITALEEALLPTSTTHAPAA